MKMHPLTFICFCAILSLLNAETNSGILETGKNPFQYFKEQNYHYENHTVVTDDGYKLLLVRFPYDRTNSSSSNKPRPHVLFVHGILSSFYDFLVAGPGVSMGYRALEKGYDVFLLNARGNRWSRNHTTLDPDVNANQFWNYSWHESGMYDVPATIDYITNLTGHSNISYVGHSQGTTCFLVMTSMRPEYNKKLNVAVLLAPVAFLDHAQFVILALLKDSARAVQDAVETLQLKEILPYSPITATAGQLLCNKNSALLPTCKTFFYDLAGPSTQMNLSMVGTYLTNYPMGTSAKQLLHFLQLSNSGKFRQYDYGEDGNILQYGQTTPPDYNLSKIITPVALYYGANDHFVAVSDARRLARSLPNVIRNVLSPYIQTNHFDALVGEMTPKMFTEPALKVLNEYNNI